MISLNLDEYTVEDFRIIQELKRFGLPDEVIQKAYDRTIEIRRENEKGENNG